MRFDLDAPEHEMCSETIAQLQAELKRASQLVKDLRSERERALDVSRAEQDRLFEACERGRNEMRAKVERLREALNEVVRCVNQEAFGTARKVAMAALSEGEG